jgi:hypothetical protein
MHTGGEMAIIRAAARNPHRAVRRAWHSHLLATFGAAEVKHGHTSPRPHTPRPSRLPSGDASHIADATSPSRTADGIATDSPVPGLRSLVRRMLPQAAEHTEQQRHTDQERRTGRNMGRAQTQRHIRRVSS